MRGSEGERERVMGVQRKESIGRGGQSNMRDGRRLKVNRGGKVNVECRVRRGIAMSQCL